MLVDCMPLAAPDQGPNRNYVFWIRLVIVEVMIIGGALHHFRCCAPTLPMRHRDLFGVAVGGTIAGTVFVYGMSFVIGFPVPFNLILQSPTCVPVLSISLATLWRKSMREGEQLRSDLRYQMLILAGQLLMTYAFALYFFAFTSLSSFAQSAFTFVLPFIKLGLKNYFRRLLRHLDDVKPAFVVFNVDVFSALYVANFLQASQSRINIGLTMIVDIVHIAISTYDVGVVMREIRELVQLDKYDVSPLNLFATCAAAPDVQTSFDRYSSQATSSKASSTKTLSIKKLDGRIVVPAQMVGSTNALVASSTNKPPVPADLSPANRILLIQTIARALYITEFVRLIEFLAVMIPIIYSIYLGVTSPLPNCAYYPQLASLTSYQLNHSIETVLMNSALELVSFLFTCWLLHRQLKLSTLHLLAFPLQTQPDLVQACLMSWV